MAGKESNSWNILRENSLVENFPLHRACRDGDVDLLTNYLQQKDKAKPHLSMEDTYYGWTPLHWAAYFGKPDCVRLLLINGDAGGEKSATDLKTSHFNQTPLHIAAFAGHPQCLQELLIAGADPNAQDYLGETPLHKAARTGSNECASLLVNNKSQPWIKNNCDQTAVELAHACGSVAMANYMLKSLDKEDSHLISSNGYYGFQPSKKNPNAEDDRDTDMSMDMDTDTVSANFSNGTHYLPPVPNGTHKDANSGFNLTTVTTGIVNDLTMTNIISNGTGHIPTLTNGTEHIPTLTNGTGHIPTLTNGPGHIPSNGFQNVFHNGIVNGAEIPYNPVSSEDITLSVEVSQNQIPIAGIKRSREESLSTFQLKRFRTEGGSSLLSHADTSNEAIESLPEILLSLHSTLSPVYVDEHDKGELVPPVHSLRCSPKARQQQELIWVV